MYVPFRIRKFMLRCWQSIEVPICFRWLDKTVEPWRSMTVSLNEFLLGHLKVLWNEPRQKKYKVHTGFWYVCSNIYIYIRYRIFLHMLIWWNSSNNIYIYTRSRSARKKGIPFFFHFISTEHSVVEFIFAHQGDATCARAAAFVAHRTASWAGRLVAQRVWNTLVKTYRLVGGNTMFVGKLPRGFNLCVQKFGRKGMVCVSTLVWVYMFWCQK